MSARTALTATLTHRYSFDADAEDSVGGANGLLRGDAYVTNGALVLDGINSSVQLPNDLFTNYASISIEAWFSLGPMTSPYSRLYWFGGPSGSMSYQLGGVEEYLLGAILPIASRLVLPVPPVQGEVHLVWTQDGSSHTARLYVNGLLAGQNDNFSFMPTDIGRMTNDCIGGIGSISTVSNFQGSILEFRSYQGAMTPLDVAVADALGPDQTQLAPGALLAVRIIAPPPVGPGAALPLTVYADFESVTNVNISALPDLVLGSDNPNVIVVAPDQRLQTLGLGVANITATYDELSNTVPVTVGVPQDAALIHRYSFNEPTNDWIVHDSINRADGELCNIGAPTHINAAFTGTGELSLAGGTGTGFVGSGYVSLPSGLVSSLSEVSIEAWITWTLRTSWPWQRIFDFGSQSNFNAGQTYLFLTTEANTYVSDGDVARFTVTTNGILGETPRLDWTNTLPLNVTSFVAVTYSPMQHATKLYVNGQPVAAGNAAIPLSSIIDTNNWLGRSQWRQDSYFGGRYDEFRIYRGFLSDADVAADYAAGPNVVGSDYQLHILPSTNSLIITWGATATNWFLESSPVLGPDAVWTTIQTKPALQDGRWRMTVPITGNAAYFRLCAP